MGNYSNIKMICRADDFASFRDFYLKQSAGDDDCLLDGVSFEKGCAIIDVNRVWDGNRPCVYAFDYSFYRCFTKTDRPAMFYRVDDGDGAVETIRVNDTSRLGLQLRIDSRIEVC